jgi:uncharacterized membrane protein YcaP (DUF421 family)
MLALGTPVWDIALRCGVVYLVLLIGLRLAGKREIGQMTVFDLVVLLLISNAVQNAMVGPDTSLVGGLVAAAVLLAVNALLARLRLRWPRLRRMVEGSPTLLVVRGQVMTQAMLREGLDRQELDAAIREHGVVGIEEVDLAVLETDGSISVVPAGSPMKRGRRRAKFLRHA